jgi:hypothetical protein
MKTQQPNKDELSKVAKHLGRLGGLRGGPARAAAMTAEQRSAAARWAANVRWSDKVESGMEEDDDPKYKDKQCRHPGHQPPSMIVIPPGKRYRHVCPGCGKTTIIRSSPNISW